MVGLGLGLGHPPTNHTQLDLKGHGLRDQKAAPARLQRGCVAEERPGLSGQAARAAEASHRLVQSGPTAAVERRAP